MANQQDIEWATSFSPLLQRESKLPPLNELIAYTDHGGVISKHKKGHKYPGTTALDKLVSSQSLNDRTNAQALYADPIKLAYDELRTYCKAGSMEKLYQSWGNKERTLFRIYERYLNNEDFPMRPPKVEELSSILGIHGEKLKDRSILRAVIHYYLTHFMRLASDSRKWLADRLLHAINQLSSNQACPRSLQAWTASAALLFSVNADEALAKQYLDSGQGNFVIFCCQINISSHTSIASAVRFQSLCLQLERISMSGDHKVFNEILNEKDEKINSNWCVGAKSLEILINRAMNENAGLLPEGWADFIVDIGSHPDPALSSKRDHYHYWHWATPDQLDIARMAFVKRDLEVVFEYLKIAAERGQIGGHMVKPRVTFFKSLLRKGLIKDTRLFLGINVDHNLKHKMGKEQFWDLHSAGDPDLCILALKLADGINLTTGTKSFPMRFFPRDSEPFERIWTEFKPSRKRPIFNRNHFMIDEFIFGQYGETRQICIRKPHQGDWKRYIIDEILPDPFLGRVDWSHHNI